MSFHHIFLNMDDPWLVRRHFNIVTNDGESTIHNTYDRCNTTFSEKMMDCGLDDPSFIVTWYTWTNG